MTQQSFSILSWHTLGVFLCFTSICFILHQFLPGFLGTDVLYHVAHARHIAHEGLAFVTHNWFPTHLFAQFPINPYLLYHLSLAGIFFLFGDSILIFELYTSVLSAAVFSCFYIALRYYRVQYAGIWTLFVSIISTSFLFRLLLDRPFTIGIILFFVGTILLLEKKYYWLFVLTIVYILSYNLAVFLILPATILIIVRGLIQKEWVLAPWISVLGGLLVGLILHPHTISYILLIKAHVFDLFALQFQGIPLPIGGEIIPMISTNFFIFHIYPLTLFIATLIITLLQYHTWNHHQKVRVITLMIISLCWFPITIAIHRGLEYWYLITMLWAALVLTPIITLWCARYQRNICMYIASMILITQTCILALFFHQVIRVSNKNHAIRTEISHAIPHVPTDAHIWTPAWHYFTYLFFTTPIPVSHTYTMAFDPVFLYLYNVDLYYSWYQLQSDGATCLSHTNCTDMPVTTLLDGLFDATIAIIPHEYNISLPDTHRIYESTSFSIYKIK